MPVRVENLLIYAYKKEIRKLYKVYTMEMHLREEKFIQILTCRGRLDVQVSNRLKERVQEILNKGSARLIIDLDGIELLDSSGLGALVACLRRGKEQDGEIKLAGLRPEVRSIFEITRVSRVFDIYEDVSEALAAFNV